MAGCSGLTRVCAYRTLRTESNDMRAQLLGELILYRRGRLGEA